MKVNTNLLKRWTLYLFTISILPTSISAQSNSQESDSTIYYRDYVAIYGLKNDVLNSSENFRTGLKLFSDAYFRGLAPRIKNKTVRNTSGFVWSFLVKWSSMLWPHEFGHMLRTNQAGGKFSFEKFAFPGLIGKLELPDNATPEDHTLALIGGFEANYITARDVQLDFYKNNGMYNDELGMAFGHRIMYPLYTFAFAYQDPKNPQTWIESGGDPVNFTKLVWEMGNKEVIDTDGNVNDGLVKFYNNAAILSVIWNLIDLNLYKQAGAFFGNELEGKKPMFIGNNTFSWSYGTLFNTSVLGAELYLNNYLKMKGNFYSFYFKYGFPFKNNGVGFYIPNILRFKKISFDIQADLWTQDYYGNGLSLNTTTHYRIKDKFSLMAQTGYKSEGYMLGKTTREGLIGYLGIKFNL